MGSIKFKSTPENYHKEETGTKNNTVREMKDWDYKRVRSLVNASFVIITNSDTLKSFKRRISDKTVYNGLVIITWFDES